MRRKTFQVYRINLFTTKVTVYIPAFTVTLVSVTIIATMMSLSEQKKKNSTHEIQKRHLRSYTHAQVKCTQHSRKNRVSARVTTTNHLKSLAQLEQIHLAEVQRPDPDATEETRLRSAGRDAVFRPAWLLMSQIIYLYNHFTVFSQSKLVCEAFGPKRGLLIAIILDETLFSYAIIRWLHKLLTALLRFCSLVEVIARPRRQSLPDCIDYIRRSASRPTVRAIRRARSAGRRRYQKCKARHDNVPTQTRCPVWRPCRVM